MKKPIEELQNEFLNIQHKGKQSLRLFILGMMILLFLYCGLQGYLMSILFTDSKNPLFTYIWRIGVQLLWILPFWQLWKYHKFGKLLYLVCLLYSLYCLKDMYNYVVLQQQTFTMYHYICLLLACAWRIVLCLGQIKLLHNSHIRSIWSVYDMFDEELNEELDVENEREEPPVVREGPIAKKAKKFLHTYAVGMGILLYSFIIVVLLFLYVLKIQSPSMKESIEIIERCLFGNFLFSAFLWMAPMVAMSMYHRSTRWLLIITCVIEIVKILFTFSSYQYIYISPLVNISAKAIFTVIELLRLTILLLWTFKVLRNPYSYRLWQKQGVKD